MALIKPRLNYATHYRKCKEMRIRHADHAIPRSFRGHPAARGLVLEKDIGVFYGRLKAKVLVFDSRRSFRSFWKGAIGSEAGRKTAGICTSLSADVISFKDGVQRKWREVDPRYFCLIALFRGKITEEIVVHESVHAGFAYSMRTHGTTSWKFGDSDLDEEDVCYPAGRIAWQLLKFLKKHDLMDTM